MLNVNLSILSCYPSALVCVIDVLRNNDELQNSQNINIINNDSKNEKKRRTQYSYYYSSKI